MLSFKLWYRFCWNLVSCRSADVLSTIGRKWDVFSRNGRQIGNSIRDRVGSSECDYDALRVWRVREGDVAARVGQKRSGVPCLPATLERVRRKGAVPAYSD